MNTSEQQRLSLIAQAAIYCQKVKSLGMPSRCYAKALREPIHFLWELFLPDGRRVAKYQAAQYRSISSKGKIGGKGELVYDHAIPFIHLQKKLMEMNFQNIVNNEFHELKMLLEMHCIAAVITKEEDTLLRQGGYRSKMPDNWNGIDPTARYEAVGIELGPNTAEYVSTQKICTQI